MKNKIVNAILETYLLSKKEIDYLCNKAVEHNVDFVKTSTGYSKKGSELEVVRFIKRIVKSEVQIKASGRIKTKDKALDFIDAGADRIATSSGIQIVS
jgi:deoxyribose-phosphate aldolase